jgi:hypothetical protein
MVEKPRTQVESDDAKAGAPQRPAILPGPASEIEQARFPRHLPQHLS